MTTTTTHTLHITPRAAALTIAADHALERPYQLSWEGAEPTVREQSDEVHVGYALGGRLRAMSRRGAALTVVLNPAVAWAIELDGGVSGLRADLRDLEVAEITITGGASDVELDLREPSRELALRVAGGLSQATVRRPAGVPVAVEIEGGASELRLDDQHLGAVGGVVRQRTGRRANGSGEIAVRVAGGASGLSVARLRFPTGSSGTLLTRAGHRSGQASAPR
jgi:hypothetical protein